METANADVDSWSEIRATVLLTSALSCAFLVVFEFSRRNAMVAFVFDRRRASKPDRTPPPLMRSRFFEWLFLSTDFGYSDLADSVNKEYVIRERKRKRHRSVSSRWMKGKTRDGVEDLERGMVEQRIVEEDNPEVSRKKHKRRLSKSSAMSNTPSKPPRHPLSSPSSDQKLTRFPISSAKSQSSTGLVDLDADSSIISDSSSVEFCDDGTNIPSPESSPNLVNKNHSKKSLYSNDSTIVASNENPHHSRSQSEPYYPSINSIPKPKYKRTTSTASSIFLSPDVVEVNGRRLPASIAEYAIAGDLTENQLREYERRLAEREMEEEEEFQRYRDSVPTKGMFGRFLGVFKRRGSNESEEPKAPLPVPLTKSKKNPPKINRHLKSTDVTRKRPLSAADAELLRCVGLDTFVMLRFLRFGFDVTFYPFCVGCCVLIPTYYFSGHYGRGSYFAITMSHLRPGNKFHWVSWGYATMYFSFILRRIWVEWETFIALRFDFLANGDKEMTGFLVRESGLSTALNAEKIKRDERKRNEIEKIRLIQYQTSCLINFIPESHRRDKELFEFFDALFPGQVTRAEILLNSSTLTQQITERQKYIEMYERLYANYFHDRAVYRHKLEKKATGDVGIWKYLCCRCCGISPKKPEDPKVSVGKGKLCRKKMVKALPYYLSEIKRLNRLSDEQHRQLSERKELIEDKEAKGLIYGNVMQGLRFVTGEGSDLTCDTGFVQFKTLTAKQTAIQCNNTGQTEYMVTTSAPDPRDINWENATVKQSAIDVKRIQCQGLLCAALLFWSPVVTAISTLSNLDSFTGLPRWMVPEDGGLVYSLVQGYLPVIFLEGLMKLIPILLKFVATRYIRFKTSSEVDTFIYQWHFFFRLANLLLVIIGSGFIEYLGIAFVNPDLFIRRFALSIASTSQFFLNNAIFSIGENMWELAQITNMGHHFVMYKFITVEAKSKRDLEKLQETESFEWGEVVPSFIFTFMYAVIYSTTVPVVIGACSIFFFIANKVYTHQALFVYSQPYEGGGKLMYQLNRTIFIILYITIILFGMNLLIKDAKIAAIIFMISMIIVTYIVDRKVVEKFVNPSLTLALTNARIIDEENKCKDERAAKYREYKRTKTTKTKVSKMAAQVAAHAKNGSRDDSMLKFHDISRCLSDDSSAISDGKHFADDSSTSSISFFPVWKEGHPDKVKERHLASITRPTTSKGNDDAGRNQNAMDKRSEFYLFRQPQMNKTLWETKPRPYR